MRASFGNREDSMTIRTTFAATGLAFAFAAPAYADHSLRHLEVTKTPTCGCCAAWVDIAEKHGFEVTVTDTADYVGMKREARVPQALWSCHTTRVGGYTVEGHVPMAAIEALLEEKPQIEGISVPGMPMGSPGMGSDPNASYDVLSYSEDEQGLFGKVKKGDFVR